MYTAAASHPESMKNLLNRSIVSFFFSLPHLSLIFVGNNHHNYNGQESFKFRKICGCVTLRKILLH
jgi:hypothetical protein